MQIGCDMAENEAVELTEYAESLELTRPTLCALLIHRELRRPRLKRLVQLGEVLAVSEGPKRVTVRISDPAFKEAYREHVRSCRLGSDDAAALLFRTELKERWVLNRLSWCGNRS